jgi:hypothetical protein
MITTNFKPIFTIRRTKALEELNIEALVALLPLTMQEEVERINSVFSNIDSISDKIIVNPCSGESIQGKKLTKEEILLLFDPAYEEIPGLTKEEQDLVYIASDPVLWCRVYLKMNPKAYQILVLRENKPRVILRWGRRSGKSTTMAIRMLWKSLSRPGNKSLIVAPMLSHVDVTWDMVIELIKNDEELKAMWDAKEIKQKKQPHHQMDFPNGSIIKGFTSGMRSNNNADNLRGQEADDLYLDEIDYMNAADLKAIMAIVQQTSDGGEKRMVVSSTPSGRRDMMYKFASDFTKNHPELYKEYYIPTHCNIMYTEIQDEEFKMVYSHNQYLHEIIADFGEESAGVFLQAHIERAIAHIPDGYKYELAGMSYKKPGIKRVVGVDWDKIGAGVNIVISDIDLWSDLSEDNVEQGRVKIVARFEVPRGEYTLTEGKKLIKSIYLTYKPDLIVLDKGYGEDQYEDISLTGLNDPMYKGLKEVLRGFNFHQNVEIWDPMSRGLVKKEAKDRMVDLTINLFEQDKIILNKRDPKEVPGLSDIIKQFESYVLVGLSIYGKPRYEAGNTEIGDHALDAFMLTILGANTEWGEFSRARKTPRPLAVNFDARRATGRLLDMDKDFDVEDPNDIKYIRRSMWKKNGRSDKARRKTIRRSNF